MSIVNKVIVKNGCYVYDSGNSKKSVPHGLLLNASDKIYLKSGDKIVALPNISKYYAWKAIKRLIQKQ